MRSGRSVARWLARGRTGGFTLLEMLVSVALLTVILTALLALMHASSSSYRMTAGRVDVLEGARAGFQTLGRTVRQASLQSFYGYNDPKAPTRYELMSDLHFVSGPRNALGLGGLGNSSYQPHAVFFQVPLGVANNAALGSANALLCSTGFFISFGDDPNRPPPAQGRTPPRYRYRLFQYIEPRENSTIYSKTLTTASEGGQTFPIALRPNDPGYGDKGWFAPAGNGTHCHVLAENVFALAILPVFNGAPAASYTWDSRDTGSSSVTRNRLPKSLKLMMAVLDEGSATRLANGQTPPQIMPPGLFIDTSQFDDDVARLEEHLASFTPRLNYRIFTSEVPLSTSDWNL